MHPWKSALTLLADAGEVMAKWSLLSRVTFYMYIPTASNLGEAGIQARSLIAYEEILYLDIQKHTKLGRLSVDSDVESCVEVLRKASGIRVTRIEDGIRVELAG